MMFMKRIFYILLVAGTLAACGNAENKKEAAEQPAEEAHQHAHGAETIELDNGQKWKVDTNMMGYIRDMETVVNAFNGTTLAEYKTLSESLNKDIELLTSNCTMEGKAHDELHKWLVPFIDLAEGFSEVTTEKDANDHYMHIKASFEEFHKYFE